MANWINKAIGEMSRLRTNIGMFGWGVVGSWSRPYKLDSSKVDYQKARELYDNTDDEYKLGAGFVKPVVNTAAAFIGVPRFRSQDEDAEKILNEFMERYRARATRIHRNSIRDGDSYVWITREEQKNKTLYPSSPSTRIVLNILPPEQVQDIILDPITSEPMAYILESEHTWVDDEFNKKKYKMIQIIKAGERIVKVEGAKPPDLETGQIPSMWNFLPIVHFKNKSDEHEKYGKSDTEAIEPFLKAYHDVMIHAITGSKMHSTPKLKLKIKDVAAFLRNNYGIDDPVKFAKEGKGINLDGKEALFLSESEDAEFIEVRSATGDAKLLLQLLFYCIVDTSETPEFVFGVHTPSSLASTKEQMPVLVRKVERKRDQFSESWQHVARIVLAMTSHGENKNIETYETTLEWSEVDPRDSKESAEEIEIIVKALSQAVTNELISEDAAVQYLSRFIDTMNDYHSTEGDSEEQRIVKSKLKRMRLEDGQFLEKQLKEIDKLLRV
ncbi:phage portal protein [Halalkalibacter sp. AB-rgal2]|uniref:phage portal protein n=1 Tax=Halalkalibacter sp. AB-rgal2 TaxID=3242695 RepID=UPI00359D6614